MKQLANRIAVVTGAASGIGQAISVGLARAGCHLALVDLDGSGLGQTQALVAQQGRQSSQHLVDVSDSAAMLALAQEVAERYGRAELLINNAGVNIHGPFTRHSVADIDWILGVNLRGVLYGCHAFLPLMQQAEEGHVVNVASLAGMVPFPMQSTYCASKFGVRGFSAALRMELDPHGIGVTAVLPGAVRTGLLGRGRSYAPQMSNRMSALMLAHGQRPEKIATSVIRAIQRNRAEVVIGPDAHLSRWLQWLSPGLLRWCLQQASVRFAPPSEELEAR